MTEALPWRISGIEPDIRDEALHAAHGVGMTLGQWLNGVIKDSLVDLKAARRPSGLRPQIDGGSQAPQQQPQQEMASQTMPPFHAQQQQPQFAPQPWQMGQPVPPYMQPALMPYYAPPPYPHPQYPAAYAPPMPAYDPVEARLRQYSRGTETAIPGGYGDSDRMLSVIDAAVRSSESKTAAAIEALTRLIEQAQSARTETPVAKPAQAGAEGINESLASLVERFSALEESLGKGSKRQDQLSQAQHQESRLSEALDTLGHDRGGPADRPSQPRSANRPRVNVVRGNTALADITARQRMLDQTLPQQRELMQAETAALDAIRRSIAALSDQVREVSQDNSRQSDFDVRAELRDLQKSVQDLAPRRIVASVNESIRGLAQKIEQSRQEGVRETNLAPIEKLLADMRVAIDDVREPKSLGTVHQALERLGHRVEEIGSRSISTAQIDDIQRQFGEIRMLIAQAQRQQPVSELQEQIAHLSDKLDGLAESPRDGKAIAIVATAVEDLRRHLERFDPDRLVARIEQRLAGLSGLEARIQELAVKVDSARGAAEVPTGFEEISERFEQRLAGLDGLGSRIEQLSARIAEANARPAVNQDFSDLTRRIEHMTQSLATRQPVQDMSEVVARIDQVREAVSRRDPSIDVSSLENRIADMQRALEVKVRQPDMAGLEQILRKLAERIETVRAPAASGAAMDALQQQIIALAERLDQPGQSAPGLGGIENTVRDLVRQIGGLKDVAASAAQDAVREAMNGGPGMGMDPLAAEGMMLIKRDLTEIRNAHQEAEVRSRNTLQQVNASLEQIVARLANVNSGPAVAQAASPQAASPQAASHQAPQAPAVAQPAVVRTVTAAPQQDLADAVSRRPASQARPPEVEARPGPSKSAMPASSSADAGLDMPLEPGVGRTAAAAPDAAGSDPRSNFIAAARRAAQAAAAQSSAALTELDAKSSGKAAKAAKAAEEGDTEGRSRIKDFIANRRKPLLLGIAALVFALGGLKVVSNLLLTEETPVETGAMQEPKASVPVRQSQLDKRLEQGLAELARKKEAESASSQPLPPVPVMQGEDKTVVGSINATTAATPAPASPQGVSAPAPKKAPIEIATLIKSIPSTNPERLRLAAANGNLAAIYEVGARLAEGRGVQRDLKSAATWLEYAAEQGYAPAQYRFGSFNREGLGMTTDAKQAFVWFQRAAEQGHILAMHNLAVLYAEGVTGSPDYAAAASWFRTAAEHGVKDSQFNIAILYVRGLGVGHDMNEAYKWFAAAAAQGDPDAIKKRDEVASRLAGDKLAQAKELAESFRARRPDPRANEVTVPEGGWDQDTKAPRAPAKKVRT